MFLVGLGIHQHPQRSLRDVNVKVAGHKRTDLIPLLIVREDNELIGDTFRNIVEVSVSPSLRLPVFGDIEIGVPHVIHDDADFHAR